MFLSQKKKKKKKEKQNTVFEWLTTRLNTTDTISSTRAIAQQVVHWTPDYRSKSELVEVGSWKSRGRNIVQTPNGATSTNVGSWEEGMSYWVRIALRSSRVQTV